MNERSKYRKREQERDRQRAAELPAPQTPTMPCVEEKTQTPRKAGRGKGIFEK